MAGKVTAKKRAQRQLADLVGVDFSSTGTKVVRIKRGKSGLVLVGLDLLPPIEVSSKSDGVVIPRPLIANYGCLVYTVACSVVRMVNTQLEGDEVTLP